MFLADNNTVALQADVTNQVRAGRIVEVVSATLVWVDPTLPPEGHGDVTVVADPASATSTNGAAALAIPGALTSTNGVAAAAAADLAALAAETEKIGDDVRAVHAAMPWPRPRTRRLATTPGGAGEGARSREALQAQGLFVAS